MIKKILKIFLLTILIIILLGLGFVTYCIVTAPKINPENIYASIEQSSYIYDDKGKLIDRISNQEDRILVQYEDMPEDLVNSFVAIEDKTFWHHHGINFKRIIGAIYYAFKNDEDISGTSTISQQLARNVYLTETKSERSIKRKIREAYYAIKIESTLKKEDVIEAYLNAVYMGYGCYGVGMASKQYFSKDVKDLDLIECAALAALPQAPDTYALIKEEESEYTKKMDDGNYANDASKERRNLVLDELKSQGYITEEEKNEVYDTNIIDIINPSYEQFDPSIAYFKDYLIDQIIADLEDQYDLTYEKAWDKVYSGGMKIYSTINANAQKVIVDEFSNNNNFPSLSYEMDGDNVITGNGETLFSKDYYFDEKGNLRLSGDEVVINDDSIIIKHGKRLNIYETEVNGEADSSLEFKTMYVIEDGELQAITGGYINIPSDYKKLKKNDLIVNKEYFDNSDAYIKDGEVVFPKSTYTISQQTIQPQAAMVIVDVKNGNIKAMVGGRKTKGERLFNRATNPRQPGSSIKPLSIYAPALQKSFEYASTDEPYPFVYTEYDTQGVRGYGSYITAASRVTDEKLTINGKEWPKNANNSYTGYQSFRSALRNSINTCAVKLYFQIGSNYSYEMARRFGISTLVSDEDSTTNDVNAAALALGGMTDGVTPLDAALAYATFPNNGVRNSGVCYTKVVDAKGNEILTGETETTEVIDSGVAWIMIDLLKGVVTGGTGKNAAIRGTQVAGKTGTTNDQYDIWFDGFTPSYAASLWIGTDQNIKMNSMSEPAAGLWGRIMSQIPEALEGNYASKPNNVIQYRGEYFTKGTEEGAPVPGSQKSSKKSSSQSSETEKEIDKSAPLIYNEVTGNFEEE